MRDISKAYLDGITNNLAIQRQFNILRATNGRPYIFPKIISFICCTYRYKIRTARAIIVILQTILFSYWHFFIILHFLHPNHYNTNQSKRQEKSPNGVFRWGMFFYFGVERLFVVTVHLFVVGDLFLVNYEV